MQFKEYWDQIPGKKKQEFAKSCGYCVGHLRNVANGQKAMTPTLAYRIDKATNGVVAKEKMCPEFKW